MPSFRNRLPSSRRCFTRHSRLALGAVIVNYAKTSFTAILPEVWLFALGGLFVLVTLFLPRGIVGLLRRRESPA